MVNADIVPPVVNPRASTIPLGGGNVGGGAPRLAIAALIFLVVIHQLEYFLNARIVGTRIRSHAWELLIAMLVMEVAFGIAGLIAAPIYYAYVKQELSDAGLV